MHRLYPLVYASIDASVAKTSQWIKWLDSKVPCDLLEDSLALSSLPLPKSYYQRVLWLLYKVIFICARTLNSSESSYQPLDYILMPISWFISILPLQVLASQGPLPQLWCSGPELWGHCLTFSSLSHLESDASDYPGPHPVCEPSPWCACYWNDQNGYSRSPTRPTLASSSIPMWSLLSAPPPPPHTHTSFQWLFLHLEYQLYHSLNPRPCLSCTPTYQVLIQNEVAPTIASLSSSNMTSRSYNLSIGSAFAWIVLSPVVHRPPSCPFIHLHPPSVPVSHPLSITSHLFPCCTILHCVCVFPLTNDSFHFYDSLIRYYIWCLERTVQLFWLVYNEVSKWVDLKKAYWLQQWLSYEWNGRVEIKVQLCGWLCTLGMSFTLIKPLYKWEVGSWTDAHSTSETKQWLS